VFAPVCDALDRAGLGPEEIGLCMLVGGSSQIPQLRFAVMDFFENADVIMSMQNEPAQLATANGAAYQALSLALFGKGLFRVVCPDSICLQTQSGPVELVPGGVELPWPPDGGKASNSSLRVPENVGSGGQTELRVEIFGGDESRLLLSELVTLVGVENGEPLQIEYRLDENQVFDFALRLASQPDARPFEVRVENPLSNIVNPHAIRLKIQESEEDLRTGKVEQDAVPQAIVELAKQYAEIEQLDKAVGYLNRALRMLNRRDGNILNLLGIYHGELGDTEREERFYREAAAARANDPVPFFNLALAKNRWGETAEAREIVKQSLARGRTGPSLVLLAQIEEGGGNIPERNSLLAEATRIMGAVSSLGDWELGWLATAARMRKTGN
jgi:tetratricopeptide (TPR) repeat protein